MSVLHSGMRNFSCYDSRNQSKDLSYLKPHTKGGPTFDQPKIRSYLESLKCVYIQEYIEK